MPAGEDKTALEKKRLQLRYLCDHSLFYFSNLMSWWNFRADKEKWAKLEPSIHGPLCSAFQDNSFKRLALYEPRNWLKSSTFTEDGAVWLYNQNHKIKILIASQSEPIADRFLRSIKRKVQNHQLLRWLYPELTEINRDWINSSGHLWSSEQIDLPGAGYREATITSLGVTSAAQSGHYDVILIDDPTGEKHLNSPVEMDRVLRWFDNVKELLINPNYSEPFGSRIIIVATFWSTGDFGTYVQKEYPEFKWFIVPALKDNRLENSENIIWVQNPNAGQDESNWENGPGGRSSTKHYHDMRVNPQQQLIFWAQHMNAPHKADLLSKFSEDWLRYYHFDDRPEGRLVVCDDDKEELFLPDIPLFGMIDPGGFSEIKISKKTSRNALVIGGQPQGSIKKFIVYTWAGRLKEPEGFLDEIFNAHSLFHPRLWEIETIAAQRYIYKDIIEARRKRGVSLPIGELPPDVSKNIKDADIQSLLTPMQNGEFYLHRSMKELIAEIKSYPHGLTVDLLDMMGKLYRYHMSRRPREIKKPTTVGFDLEDGRNTTTGY